MYIVIGGGGKIGAYLAQLMLGKGNEVGIIERDLQTADRLSMQLEGQCLVIHGDACEADYLLDAGAKQADVFVAVGGRDDENLVACELAKQLFKVQRCFARVNNPKNQRIFKEVGIESVSSTMIIANLIDEASTTIKKCEAPLFEGKFSVLELEVPLQPRRFDPEKGVQVGRIPMPQGSTISAVYRKASDYAHIVNPELRLMPGDVAVIIAHNDVKSEVRRLFDGL